jgi:hypothetical protein
MAATFQWLRERGYMVKGNNMTNSFTVDEQTEISRAFDSGNYANAYESTDLEQFADDLEDMKAHQRAAFVLGFFSSCELDEINDRATFDQAYWSAAGQYVVKVAGYTDDRADEYAQEAE